MQQWVADIPTYIVLFFFLRGRDRLFCFLLLNLYDMIVILFNLIICVCMCACVCRWVGGCASVQYNHRGAAFYNIYKSVFTLNMLHATMFLLRNHTCILVGTLLLFFYYSYYYYYNFLFCLALPV